MQLLMEIDMYILVHFIAEGFVLLVVLSILMDILIQKYGIVPFYGRNLYKMMYFCL